MSFYKTLVFAWCGLLVVERRAEHKEKEHSLPRRSGVGEGNVLADHLSRAECESLLPVSS